MSIPVVFFWQGKQIGRTYITYVGSDSLLAREALYAARAAAVVYGEGMVVAIAEKSGTRLGVATASGLLSPG